MLLKVIKVGLYFSECQTIYRAVEVKYINISWLQDLTRPSDCNRQAHSVSSIEDISDQVIHNVFIRVITFLQPHVPVS